MTKPPIPTENSKTKGQHTQTLPKTSIAQRLRTDLGRSVGVTSNPTGVVKPVYVYKGQHICEESSLYVKRKRSYCTETTFSQMDRQMDRQTDSYGKTSIPQQLHWRGYTNLHVFSKWRNR